jgi:hypothetical protein
MYKITKRGCVVRTKGGAISPSLPSLAGGASNLELLKKSLSALTISEKKKRKPYEKARYVKL